MRSGKLVKLSAVVIWLMAVVPAGHVLAETWHLGQGKDWQKVPDDASGKYMLAVAEIKQLISTGQPAAARKALVRLKQDFPDIAGADIDAFIVAELLYARGKWVDAVREYDKFLDAYADSWLYESALEREYSVAVAFLGGEKRKVLKILKLKQ